jgi:hypothetical protein
MHHKKVISKNVTKKSPFFTFYSCSSNFFAYNFFWCIFLQLFERIPNQREILRFLISFMIFWGVIIALFANFEAERAKHCSKNQKNIFCKCVLDVNFAPIKGSVFFNF